MEGADRDLRLELVGRPTFESPPARGERDLVAMIEASYDLSCDEPEWLRRVARVAHAQLNRGSGVAAFFWDLSKEGALRIGHPVYIGCASELHRGLAESGARLTERQAHSLYLKGRPYRLLSRDARVRYARAQAAYEARFDAAGFTAVSCADLTRAGCVLLVPNGEAATPASPPPRTFNQVARHVASGLRLRRALPEPLDAADAILSPRGKLVHVTAEAGGRREQGALVVAARRLLESRKARRSRTTEAVELWRALVLGRWSLVDHHDSDGKRFLVARRNPLGVPEPRSLTQSERRAALLFALLGSVKLVAYELGLAPSTISGELRSACIKLGCRDRAELAGLLQPLLVGAGR